MDEFTTHWCPLCGGSSHPATRHRIGMANLRSAEARRRRAGTTIRGHRLAASNEVERDLPWLSSEEMNRRRAEVWAYEFLDEPVTWVRNPLVVLARMLFLLVD